MLGPVAKGQRKVKRCRSVPRLWSKPDRVDSENIPGLVLGSSSSVLGMTEAHKKPFRNRNYLDDIRINEFQIRWNKNLEPSRTCDRVRRVELQRCCPQFVQIHGNCGNIPVLLWVGSDVVEQQWWENRGRGKKWWRDRWVCRVVKVTVHLNVLQWELHSIAPYHDSILPNSCRSREILWKVSKPLYKYEARSQPESAHTPEQQGGRCENF